MKNIHVIPTDKPILYGSINYILKCIKEFKIYNKQYNIGDVLDELGWDFDSKYWKPQNIYITNDEEIKEGDWVYYENGDLKGIHKVVKGQRPKTMILRKIILTTDQDLIKDGVQAIDDEFLEWFVKNPSCEDVEIEYLVPKVDNAFQQGILNGLAKSSPHIVKKPHIIIPKEEPKQDFSDKNYTTELERLGKQETLEEAFRKFKLEFTILNDYNLHRLLQVARFGAKWQQEQNKNLYSKEDMLLFAKFVYEDDGSCVDNNGNVKKETLEQFKNK